MQEGSKKRTKETKKKKAVINVLLFKQGQGEVDVDKLFVQTLAALILQ
jgi:hypothetical protein